MADSVTPVELEQFSNFTFVFNAITEVEKALIEQLKAYFTRLRARGLFLDTLNNLAVNGVYNKEKAKVHQITVEVIPDVAIPLSFGNKIGTIEDETKDTWEKYAGKWNFTISITCRSTNRHPVAMLADIVMVGLLKPLLEPLLTLGINISINNIRFDRIVPEVQSGYENIFRIPIQLTDVSLDWIQFYREDGYVAQEIGVTLERIT